MFEAWLIITFKVPVNIRVEAEHDPCSGSLQEGLWARQRPTFCIRAPMGNGHLVPDSLFHLGVHGSQVMLCSAMTGFWR